MNWLDKFKGKIGRLGGPVGQGVSGPPQKPGREAGGTVLRAGAQPAPTLAEPGIRFQPNHAVTADLQIKNLLGSGGMGEVYLARQRQWNVDIALKIPNNEIVSDPQNRNRIVREAEAWTDLGLHPNIAYCYYVQPLGELLLLVIEYADGGNLRDWIADGRCAELKTGLDLAIQFCHGLEHAHKKGLVHRDIKPENILLMNDGTLKITDFGIVHKALTSPETSESTGAVRPTAARMTVAGVGTPDYMAPEQWEYQGEIDLRADLFAFGICLFEMLCGARPYPMTTGPRQEAPEPGRLRGKDLPARLSRLMKQCLDWDREKRPVDSREVRAELCSIYEDVFGEPSDHAELLALEVRAAHLNNRAISYLQLGRKDAARTCWERALEENPEHLESVFNYGHFTRLSDGSSSAYYTLNARVTQLESLERRYHRDPDYWRVLAWLSLELGNTGEAAEIVARKLDGDHHLKQAIQVARAQLLVESTESGSDSPVFPEELSDIHHQLRALGVKYRVGRLTASSSSDGRYLLACFCWDGDPGRQNCHLWNKASGEIVWSDHEHPPSTAYTSFSPDNGYALLWGSVGDLRFVDVLTGLEFRCLRQVNEDYSFGSLKPTADGWHAVANRGQHPVRLRIDYPEVDWRSIHPFPILSRLTTVSAATIRADKAKRLVLVARAAMDRGQFRTAYQMLCEVRELDPDVFDLSRLLSDCAKAAGGIRSALDDSRLLFRLGRESLSVSFSPDSRLLYAGGNTIYRVNGEVETELTGLKPEHLKFSTDGTRLFVASSGRYYVWSLSDHALSSSLSIGVDHFSSHGRVGLSAHAQGSIAIMNLETGQVVKHCICGSHLIECLKLFCNDRFFLAGGRDKTVRLVDVDSGSVTTEFRGHDWKVTCLDVAPICHRAVSGGADSKVILWDLVTGAPLRVLNGHTGQITSVWFSAEGRYLFSAGDDGAIILWDLLSGSELTRFKVSSGAVQSISVSPDGNLLAASAVGGTTVWSLEWRWEFQ